MPFNVNTYVRYWDGYGVGYGKIVAVNVDGTYDVRAGGTDFVRKVSEGDISIHPVHVASGRKMDQWVMFEKIDVTGAWLYHATAYELLPSIVIHHGLVPRSSVNWAALDVGWKGADAGRSTDGSVEVSMSSYYSSMKQAWSLGAESMYRKTLMGDPGEFVYATKWPHAAAEYAIAIHKKAKKAIAFRFKSKKVWYRDPNQSSAVITNTMIRLEDMQVKYISKTDFFLFDLADALGDDFLADDDGWIGCSSPTWRTQIDTLALTDT